MIMAISLAGAAPDASAPPATPSPAPEGRKRNAGGRTFISPMGEPYRPDNPEGSGLAMWFKQADANHDGALTAAEMQQDAVRFFATLDVRRDGEIDPEDVDRYENEIAPEIRAGSFDAVIVAREPITSADYDFNRGTSLAEFTKAALERFRALDSNHDGRLTLAELEVLQDATRSERRRIRYKNTHDNDDDQSGSSIGMDPAGGGPM